MKKLNKHSLSILLVATVAAAPACDSEHQVGDDPTDGTSTKGLQLENVVAAIADEYQCPAGFIGGYDDVTSCSCDTTSFDCDITPGFPTPCSCDAMCHDARPMIACADYSITFRISNGTGQRIDRMTRVTVKVGELELKEGGLDCDGTMWAIYDGSSSPVISLELTYDPAHGSSRYAEANLDYPCRSGDRIVVKDGANSSDDLGSPMPPAVSVGSDAIVTVEGLLEDGSPWKLEATAQLQ